MTEADTSTWSGRSSSVAQTEALGRALGRQVAAGDLLALVGELGAGKTQLVRGLALGLGVPAAAIASPTFVMVQEHRPAGAGPVLVHIDAYRLRSLEDLESIGWQTADLGLGDDHRNGGEMRRDAVVVIEWADRLGELLGPDMLECRLRHAGPTERAITLTGRGLWRGRLAGMAAELDRALAPPMPCPICGRPVAAEEPSFPFCGQRCRMVDLGRWIQGDYRISRNLEQRDLDEE